MDVMDYSQILIFSMANLHLGHISHSTKKFNLKLLASWCLLKMNLNKERNNPRLILSKILQNRDED
ncbi:hypothetical protein BpHYR1_053611 [Brachionus plicatilis]|uniref:Uncharacterized protein n=1 Tax=Brachionus plicatilis TaxID=10195 RepID=A0A3M7PH49_BRAPC|nr:hypothetical protein BpHYR1_053611 [Brachionus plicatilis]